MLTGYCLPKDLVAQRERQQQPRLDRSPQIQKNPLVVEAIPTSLVVPPDPWRAPMVALHQQLTYLRV